MEGRTSKWDDQRGQKTMRERPIQQTGNIRVAYRWEEKNEERKEGGKEGREEGT